MRLKDRQKWTEVSTAVFGKIHFIVEGASKDGNIGRPHQIVKETRRTHIHRTQRFDNVTVGIWSSIVPNHIIFFKNCSLNLDSILVAISVNFCYSQSVMATTKRTRFSRRLPDHVTDELVNVLGSDPKLFGFNELFEDVYERLKERNAVSGGEEMLRLRAYEKLQNLVTRGLAEKDGKEYRGLERIQEAHSDNLAQQEG